MSGQVPVPEPLPGEPLDDYRTRVTAHIGRVMDDVVAECEARGQEPPDWIAALHALRKSAPTVTNDSARDS